MTILINLTPHVITIVSEVRTAIVPPSGQIARVASKTETVGEVNGIPIFKQSFGEVTDLPEAKEGTFYIVSRMVKDRVPERDDVLVPGTPIRDDKGVIIGADGLSR